MSKIQVHTSRGLKRVQSTIYNSLETRRAYVVNEGHECPNEERYQLMSEGHPTVFIIETSPGMLYELNIALSVYYHHYVGHYVNGDISKPWLTFINFHFEQKHLFLLN